MVIHNISDAKAHFSALIKAVLAGKDVVIGKFGKPVAKLVPFKPIHQARRKPGRLKSKITIQPDFYTLPDDLNLAFGVAIEAKD